MRYYRQGWDLVHRPICVRVNSVVMKRSPLVRQTASERIALEIVYPGHSPAPGMGTLDSSACRPTYELLSRKEVGQGNRSIHATPGYRCFYTGLRQPGGFQDLDSIPRSFDRLHKNVRC